jgi:hypothetical protein
MTAYWDATQRDLREAAKLGDEEFLARSIEIETRVIEEVSLVTGDREFPDDLRDRIQGIVWRTAIDYDAYVQRGSRRPRSLEMNERSKRWLLTMRYSVMCEELHAAFHSVAQQRPPNRFDSFFTDDPSSFLRAREAAVRG